MRLRRPLIVLVAVGALLVGCTAGDDDSASSETTTDQSAESTTPNAESGPAPGVTDDAIKVGVTFVDLKAIGDIASLDHGDYQQAFQTLFDDMNADGGVNGRRIDPVYAPVNPVGTEPAEAACTKLTQDERVFAVMGFVQGDSVLCPLEAGTAVIGGQMTPERLERAKAPWFTPESGTDLQSDIVRAMADAGEFDGTLGVYGSSTEEAQVNDIILPLLDDLGVDVAEHAIVDVGEVVDITASNAATAVIAERFNAAGVDQVLAVGPSGLGWARGIESTDYRPQLLLTDPASVQAYAADEAGRDLSVLDEAVAGNMYGPAQKIWELPRMQDCINIVEAGGVPVPEPDSIPEGSGSVYVAGTTACTVVSLFRGLVEAAGEDLDYGTLTSAADGLELELPNQPEPVTYGPPPSADGDAPAYLYDWDPETEDFALRED